MVYFEICLSVHLSVSVFSAVIPYDLDNITLQPQKNQIGQEPMELKHERCRLNRRLRVGTGHWTGARTEA